MSEIETRREFMTSWHTSPRPALEAWSDRSQRDLMHSTKSSKHVPLFRPFDLLAQPNQSLIVLENDDQRIGVESVVGAQAEFRRHVDFDTVYFQFAGRTSIETEFGEVELGPGELVFIPEGIAHRSTGSAQSLRWFAFVEEPFRRFQDSESYTSDTAFEVIRHNGPAWTIPAGREKPQKGGRVKEVMICWNDKPDDFTVAERDYDYLAGASSLSRTEKISGIRKLRVFDVFKNIAGKGGSVEPLLQSPFLEIKTYNIIGEQIAFHRALRSEEVRIHFRGNALDMSEIENVSMVPGAVTVIPRGIAHSVITEPEDDPSFLRMNFYSNLPWRYPNDLTDHAFNSTFEVKTAVHQEAAWRRAAQEQKEIVALTPLSV